MILAQQTKHALGSTAVLTVVGASSKSAHELLGELWEDIDEFEASFSRFRTDSELTYFNQQAGKLVPITPAFRDLLVASQSISRDTAGLYNPFILPALQQAGYVGSWPNTGRSDPKLDFSGRRLHDMSKLKLEDGTARIPKSAALDFGSIGKGYLLELLANKSMQQATGFWFALGGDIVCAGLDATGNPWRLYVQAAQNKETSVGYIENTDGGRLALATSGVTKRGGTAAGRNWHHLIDPRTGLSSTSDILTASISARSALKADVYASCVVLLGSQNGRKFLDSRRLSGLIQTDFTTPDSNNLHIVGSAFTISSERRQP